MLLRNGEEPSGHGVPPCFSEIRTRCLPPINIGCGKNRAGRARRADKENFLAGEIFRFCKSNIPSVSHPATRKQYLNRLQRDFDIQKERAVFDVKQIVRELYFRLRNIRAVVRMVLVVQLRPAGKSGLYEVADVVVRNLFFIYAHEFWQFWTRTDK